MYIRAGVPAVITGLTASFVGNQYATTWTCWGNMESALTYSLFGVF
jgi:hypothetical protein